MNTDEQVSLARAADDAGVAIGTLRQWIDRGLLPATSGPRGRLVRLSDVRSLSGGAAPDEAGESDSGPATGGGSAREARPRRYLATSNVAALMGKFDELYRSQIAAKDGELGAKDELIAELRRRAERAEHQAAQLEQQLFVREQERERAVASRLSPGRLLRSFVRGRRP